MEDKNSLDLLLNNLFPVGKKETENTETADKSLYSRQINALSAAIPYLNPALQKNVFVLMKLLEFKRFSSEKSVMAMQSKEQPFSFINTSKMAQDVRKSLNEEEKKVFDTLFRMVMIRNFAGGKNGGLQNI
ncbi:MAG: hypothetical protein IKU80_01480 [Firmicutes bacterium]|nr:hypothetical protein [Bacillota bacterium]